MILPPDRKMAKLRQISVQCVFLFVWHFETLQMANFCGPIIRVSRSSSQFGIAFVCIRLLLNQFLYRAVIFFF
jgi:hypothetical protein